jgi:hypothetical protein
MRPNQFFIAVFSILAGTQSAQAAEHPFAPFEGRYRVLTERCFSDIYKHPGLCSTQVKALIVSPQSEGLYRIIEENNTGHEPFDISERNEQIDSTHSISATVSGDAHAAKWHYLERDQKNGTTRIIAKNISAKNVSAKNISLSEKESMVLYTNETQETLMQGTSFSSPRYFLRVLELQKE